MFKYKALNYVECIFIFGEDRGTTPIILPHVFVSLNIFCTYQNKTQHQDLMTTAI